MSYCQRINDKGIENFIPPDYNINIRGIGSAGRASRSQCEGRGFESHMLHHNE